jgi:hypothetical protein
MLSYHFGNVDVEDMPFETRDLRPVNNRRLEEEYETFDVLGRYDVLKSVLY